MAYNVKFLKGTAAQFKAEGFTPDVNTFYYIDGTDLYLGSIKLSNASDLTSAIARIAQNESDISTIQGQLTTLTGSGDGSIAKMIETAINGVKAITGELKDLDTAAVSLVAAINAVEDKADAAKTAAEGAQSTADAKVASVTATDKSIEISGTATAPTVGVKISNKAGNNLSLETTEGSEGLYVNVPSQTDYTVTVETSTPEGYAKAYTIKQLGSEVATINIPKDMVVESGSVEVNPEGQPAGTYLVLTLANATNDKVYINVGDLIEYVTSGSKAGDMVVIDIDSDHKVTATITDGTVTKAKLHTDVQTSLNKADSALQKSDIVTGTANGTVSVGGSDVAVKGLDSAAYAKTTDFDAAGSATTAETNAKSYADGLAVNYDAAGSASTAESNAKSYTDTALTWATME